MRLDESVRQRQRVAPKRATAPYDVVLTSEGRRLIERKVTALRTEVLPTLWRAVLDDRAAQQIRDSYEDRLTELRRLESALAQAEPVTKQTHASGQVGLGDRFKVAFLHPRPSDDGATGDTVETVEEFLLVHPFEAPLDLLRISVASPLGRAVLGRQVGDLVSFDTPTGRRTVRVLERRRSS